MVLKFDDEDLPYHTDYENHSSELFKTLQSDMCDKVSM